MKKALSLLLAVSMLLALAACGSKPAETTTTKPAATTTAKPAESTTAKPAESTTAKPAESTTAAPALPAGFPSQNFTCIIPTAAGSAVDVITRTLTDAMSLGANLVVENKAGASQTTGTADMLNRDHSYTFSSVSMAGLIAQPIINKQLSYKAENLIVLGHFAVPSQSTVAVKAGSTLFTDGQSFVDYLKNCESFTYGVANVGGISQLSISQVLLDLGVYEKGTEIVYNGNGELTAAMLAGEVDFGIQDNDVMVGKVASGDMSMICALTAGPDILFPNSDYIGKFDDKFVDMPGFKVLVVSADTDPAVVSWLKAKFDETVQSEAYQAKLESMGYPRMTKDFFMSLEETQAWIDELVTVATDIIYGIGLAE